MMQKAILFFTLVLLNSLLQAQDHKILSNKSDTLLISNINIDSLIILKEKDTMQQKWLINFKNKCGKDDNISVEEFQTCYRLVVKHAWSKEYYGGAEGYKLDKKTGETSMSWHEHPMKLPEIEGTENKKEKNTVIKKP